MERSTVYIDSWLCWESVEIETSNILSFFPNFNKYLCNFAPIIPGGGGYTSCSKSSLSGQIFSFSQSLFRLRRQILKTTSGYFEVCFEGAIRSQRRNPAPNQGKKNPRGIPLCPGEGWGMSKVRINRCLIPTKQGKIYWTSCSDTPKIYSFFAQFRCHQVVYRYYRNIPAPIYLVLSFLRHNARPGSIHFRFAW